MPEWLTAANLVDAAGIAGFVLSLILALSQLLANRLRVKSADGTIIETDRARDSIFLHICLYNRTNLPFSLIDVHIDAGCGYRNIPVERTVRTYYSKGEAGKRAPAGPVVLSPAFPVRFDSYDAEVLLLEVRRQHIDMKSLHLDESDRSQTARLRKRCPQIHRLCKRRPPLQLKLRTSRGQISVPVLVESVQGWDWLEEYAVQKAGHEEKISFS